MIYSQCLGCSGFGDNYLDNGDIVTCSFCFGSGNWSDSKIIDKESKTAKEAIQKAVNAMLEIERIALNKSKPH